LAKKPFTKLDVNKFLLKRRKKKGKKTWKVFGLTGMLLLLMLLLLLFSSYMQILLKLSFHIITLVFVNQGNYFEGTRQLIKSALLEIPYWTKIPISLSYLGLGY